MLNNLLLECALLSADLTWNAWIGFKASTPTDTLSLSVYSIY